MTTSSTTDRVIVVGVDGSDASKDALRWAGRQAEMTGASLEVIMSCSIPMAVYSAPYPIPAVVDIDASRASLDRIVGEVLGEDPPYKVSTTVVEGPAPVALVDAAEHAELLVVGSRGHSALVGVLLGSVSEHCIAHAACPVAVIRHRHSSTPPQS